MASLCVLDFHLQDVTASSSHKPPESKQGPASVAIAVKKQLWFRKKIHPACPGSVCPAVHGTHTQTQRNQVWPSAFKKNLFPLVNTLPRILSVHFLLRQ